MSFNPVLIVAKVEKPEWYKATARFATAETGAAVRREPYLVEEICNGCGSSENTCPLETKAGIEVFAVKNRPPISARPAEQPADPYPPQ